MPQLSIVVNYQGESQPLEATLLSVLENRPPNCEVIVVHDGSYDDPYDLDGEVAFVYARRGSGDVEQVNVGLQAASGKILHLLGAGWKVTADWWRGGCQPLLDFGDVGCVAPLVVSADQPNQVVCAGLRYRQWRRQPTARDASVDQLRQKAPADVVGPPLQAGFYRREDVVAAGRFAGCVGPLADLDLALTLNHAGLRCMVALDSIVEAGADEPVTGGFQLGLFEERLFWRHAPFLGWRKSLVNYPWLLIRDWLTGFWSPATYQSFLGRMRGLLEKSDYEAFREQAAHFQHMRRRKPITRRTHGHTVRVDDAHQGRRTDDPTVRV